MKLDIVIPVKTSLVSLVIEKTIPSVLLNLQCKQIFVITRKENFESFQNSFKDSITLVDEDNIIEGLTLDKVKNFLRSKKADDKRAGWYFQQFIKLGISRSNMITGLYLVWDADCVVLKPITFVSEDHKVLYDTTNEHHQPYFDINERLIGIKKNLDHSFISEHLLFDKTIVSSLLDQLSNKNKNDWWFEILNEIDTSMLSLSGFSEYELYGNFVAKNYPEHYKIRKLRKTRNGTRLFGMTPSASELKLCSYVFDFMSFEEWHNMYKPLPLRYFKLVTVLLITTFKNLFNNG